MLVCLVVSSAFWFILAMSRDYQSEQVSYAVTYLNLPTDKVLLQPLEDTIVFEVQNAKGRDLIQQYWLAPKTLTIDYARIEEGEKVPVQRVLRQLRDQLPYMVDENAYVSPEYLYFRFEERKEKLLPIDFQADVTLAYHFEMKRNIDLEPEFVTVSGPKSIIDTLKSWKTETVTLRELNKTFEDEVDLLQPAQLDARYFNLTLSEPRAKYRIDVEEYTEKSIWRDIDLVNVPPGMELYIFPKRAKLTFQVGVSNFLAVSDEINEKFEVVADVGEVDVDKANQIPVLIAKAPSYIRNIEMDPSYVEFVIVDE